MKVWRTKRVLPGILKGTKGFEMDGLVAFEYTDPQEALTFGATFTVAMCEKHTDVFELVEDEPKYVDVEIRNNGGRLSVDVPLWVWDDDAHPSSACICTVGALDVFADFDAYVFRNGEVSVVPRKLVYNSISGMWTSQLATHARFRRRTEPHLTPANPKG